MQFFKRILMACSICILMSSCYVQTYAVGNGSQGNNKVVEWNHYLIEGLAPVSVSDPTEMTKNKTDYSVTTKHSFVNGLIRVITLGIYTPTTTIVRY